MPDSLLIDELTSFEIAGLLRSGYDSVIVPLGSTEQHGPALPLLVDNEHGLQTALRAAKLMGTTLVGPVTTLGYSLEHRSFAGTVSLSWQTLAGVIHDVAESHARSGFRMVYFWVAHGGNNPVLQSLLPQLQLKWPGCYVTGVRDLGGYIKETWDKAPLEMGMDLARSGSHAGEFETSMMLAVRPELVRLSKAEEGYTGPVEALSEKIVADGIQAISPNGVLGDQRPADAGRGNLYLDKLAAYLVMDFERERRAMKQRGNP